MEITEVNLQVYCNRCDSTFDWAETLSGSKNEFWCPKCGACVIGLNRHPANETLHPTKIYEAVNIIGLAAFKRAFPDTIIPLYIKDGHMEPVFSKSKC